MSPMRVWVRCLGGMTVMLLAFNVYAQQFPNRPLRIVVPFATGGSADLVARLLGQRLADSLGQQVVIDNRGGAAGMIGNELVAKAPPDGYTMTIGTLGPFAVNQSLFKKMPYDPQKDFAPITLTGLSSHILVVHPSVPARNVKELVALAKARPGQLAFASSGIGNATHLTGELFKVTAGIDIVHVPYKGGGPAMTDLMGGQVSFSFASMASALPYVRADRLRALAVGAGKRSATVPDLPTVAESGLPGFASEDWQGILAPARTPPELVSRLNSEIARILNAAEMKERLLASGFEARSSTPEWFGDFIKAEATKWARVVQQAGIRAE